MPGASAVKIRGHIESWPAGFADALPGADWLAVLAPPRQDKYLISALRRRDIPGVCLYERRTRTYKNKGTQEFLVPLIGSWAFIHGHHHWHSLWETERVIRILPVRQESVFVRELADLIALLRSFDGPPIVNPGMVPGTRVKVTVGTMAGLCGIVVRRRDHARLVVNLSMLGTSVSVELPAEAVADLEPMPV